MAPATTGRTKGAGALAATALAAAFLAAGAGCSGAAPAGPPQETRVEVSFRTRQVSRNDYTAVATWALAIPRATDVQVVLFEGPGATCAQKEWPDDPRRQRGPRPVGMLFVPRDAGTGPQGAKFYGRLGHTWACGLPPRAGRAAVTVREEGGRLRGRVDVDQDLKDAGIAARMTGVLDAEVCPRDDAPVVATPAGRTRMRLEVRDPNDPEGGWAEDVTAAIAWRSAGETLVFLHRGGPVNCQNYRLLEKRGLFILDGLPAGATRWEGAVTRANFVRPRTGWSSPVPASLLRRNRVVVTERDGILSGEIEVEGVGTDPLTLREVYGDRPEAATRGAGATWTMRGTFEAAECLGEF